MEMHVALFESSGEYPAYCGMLIEDNKKLLALVAGLSGDWERIAHHMTIKLGPLPEEMLGRVGERVPITATHIGKYEDKAVAVKVFSSMGPRGNTPHVTLAVNRANGGKPFMSNKITEWIELPERVIVYGVLSEFASDGAVL